MSWTKSTNFIALASTLLFKTSICIFYSHPDSPPDLCKLTPIFYIFGPQHRVGESKGMRQGKTT